MNPFSLECYIERFDGKYAILKNGDPEMGAIRWPIHKLPQDIQLDDKVMIKIGTDSIQENSEFEIKRKLLEKILN